MTANRNVKGWVFVLVLVCMEKETRSFIMEPIKRIGMGLVFKFTGDDNQGGGGILGLKLCYRKCLGKTWVICSQYVDLRIKKIYF